MVKKNNLVVWFMIIWYFIDLFWCLTVATFVDDHMLQQYIDDLACDLYMLDFNV